MAQSRKILTMAVLLAALIATGLVPAAGQPATNEDGDTRFVVASGESPSNVELAARLSAEAFEQLPTDQRRVVIGRDDDFADALAGGLLQGDAPLLLTPTDGPLPAATVAELDRLAPEEAVILGGTAAVSEGVEAALQDRGMATVRYAGASRLETATALAEAEGGDASTVILARAFAADGSTDPTQAYADAIAGGGLAASMGWPVLLTQTDALPTVTRTYLTDHADDIDRVVVLGGTAAISDDVVAEVERTVGTVDRVAGPSRAATAVAIAEARGASSASAVPQVILVDGSQVGGVAADGLAGPDAWAAGFAAAALSGQRRAPILLTAGDALPPETEAFLSGGIGGDGVVLVCVAAAGACEAARVAAGLAEAPPPPPPAADGRIVFSTHRGLNGPAGIFEITAQGNPASISSSASHAQLTPDGRFLSYVALDPFEGNHEAVMTAVQPGVPIAFTKRFLAEGISSHGVPPAPDGSAVVALRPGDDGGLVVVEADGSGTETRLDTSPHGYAFGGVAWQDSQRILVVTDRGGVLRLSRDGTAPVEVVVPPDERVRAIGPPLVSPDGSRAVLIFYSIDPSVPTRDGAFLVDLATGGLTPIPGAEAHHTPQAWSPDGTQVLMERYGAGDSVAELVVVDLATGGRQTVIRSEDTPLHHNGAFSPDGTRVLVGGRNDSGVYADGTPFDVEGLHVVDLATGAGEVIVRMEDVELFIGGGAWSPVAPVDEDDVRPPSSP